MATRQAAEPKVQLDRFVQVVTVTARHFREINEPVRDFFLESIVTELAQDLTDFDCTDCDRPDEMNAWQRIFNRYLDRVGTRRGWFLETYVRDQKTLEKRLLRRYWLAQSRILGDLIVAGLVRLDLPGSIGEELSDRILDGILERLLCEREAYNAQVDLMNAVGHLRKIQDRYVADQIG